MQDHKTLAFLLGAVAGAAGVAALAYLYHEDKASPRGDKSLESSAKTVGKLNQLFFTLSGLNVKYQALAGQISEQHEPKTQEPLSELYRIDRGAMEDYFYYLDHIEHFEEIQQQSLEAFREGEEAIQAANRRLREAGLKPVNFSGI